MMLETALVALAVSLGAAHPPEPGVARLELALARWQAGDFAGAAEALRPADPKSGARCGGLLEPWCAWLRGQALFYAGQPEAAAAEFAAARALDPSGPVGVRALAREGEALLGAHRTEAAIARLREAVASNPSAEALLLLGNALAASGRRDEATEPWRRAFTAYVESPCSEEAGRRLEASGKLAVSDLLGRSARLLRLGLAEQALDMARRAEPLCDGATCKAAALLAQAKALAKLKRWDEAEPIFESLAAAKPAPGHGAEAVISLARASLAQSQADKATERFAAFVKRFPRHALADEAAFLGAWTAFNAGQYAECAARFEAFLARWKRSRRFDDALWYAALCSRLAGRLEDSSRLLERLEGRSPKLAAQAAYWQARNAEVPEKAVPLYRRAIEHSPTSWYAWLARLRLAENGVEPAPLGLRARASPETEPPGDRQRRAALLLQLGLAREAREELEQAARDPSLETRASAAACASLGATDLAYRLAASRLSREAFGKADPVALGLLYPRPYAAQVESSAQAVKMDPYFVWSIMRRESAFDPSATSPARAFGLMQLLLPTAQKIAQVAGAPAPEIADLHDPARNIPLATWYLAELTGRFGSAALAAAAYNGGAEAVERWIAEPPDVPLDEFVELIPYRETRHYVKGVLGDYFTYRALWSAPIEPLPFGLAAPKSAPGARF
ncbi:MAG: transglycosylase SLT domain-containing protein [Myxococcales bacterium]|jgi:soluble lytic murein transglycosylase